MKEALITGSEGFAGQHLWQELNKNNYSVSGTSFQLPEKPTEGVFQCDITKEPELNELISKLQPDVIFHLAGWTNPSTSLTNPRKTFETNIFGTLNLLESVRKINNYHPRIIVVGSANEYGPISSRDLPITENTPLNPNNPYGVTKAATWLLCHQYHVSYDMDIVYAVPFNHTGPGQLPGFLVPDIASQIVNIENGGQDLVVKTGNLSVRREVLDVRDVVRAYRFLDEKGRSGERYLICTGQSTPVSEVVEKLISFSEKKITHEIDTNKIRHTEALDIYGNNGKIVKDTGWISEITLEQTLKDILNWYRAKG